MSHISENILNTTLLNIKRQMDEDIYNSFPVAAGAEVLLSLIYEYKVYKLTPPGRTGDALKIK
jgi:hypothetical protein